MKRILRSILAKVGFSIGRRSQDPHRTLLGLCGRPIRTIIDVGANEGQFASMIAARFPEARLLCFEPLPEPHGILARWAAGMGGRVTPFNMALGAESGDAEMEMHLDHSPSSSLLKATPLTGEFYPHTLKHGSLRVSLRTLDDVVEGLANAPEPEILVKLDVQGYEGQVIRGGKRTLARASACLVEVNLDVLYEGQTSFQVLLFQLEELGLTYAGNLEQSLAPDGHVVFFDALFVRAPVDEISA